MKRQLDADSKSCLIVVCGWFQQTQISNLMELTLISGSLSKYSNIIYNNYDIVFVHVWKFIQENVSLTEMLVFIRSMIIFIKKKLRRDNLL